jgi:hypothetical protein
MVGKSWFSLSVFLCVQLIQHLHWFKTRKKDLNWNWIVWLFNQARLSFVLKRLSRIYLWLRTKLTLFSLTFTTDEQNSEIEERKYNAPSFEAILGSGRQIIMLIEWNLTSDNWETFIIFIYTVNCRRRQNRTQLQLLYCVVNFLLFVSIL